MPQTTQPIESCLWPQLDSPSFFNPVEASKIAELVEALLSSRRVQCKTSDIGIISAFRKQVITSSSPLERGCSTEPTCGPRLFLNSNRAW
jgi:hypothetical protein